MIYISLFNLFSRNKSSQKASNKESYFENPVPPAVQKTTSETSNKEYLQAIKNRRSIYALSKDPVLTDEELHEMLEHVSIHVPSVKDIHTSRMVLLLHDEHEDLWAMTSSILETLEDQDTFVNTKAKLEMFAHAYGTILFFEDEAKQEQIKTETPQYKEYVSSWSQQSSGMLQFTIWTALEMEGYGASLQHFNPLINTQVRDKWNLPSSWKLIAQMPFGKPVEYPNKKQVDTAEKRLLVSRS
ncbi:putative oxidoreductase (fatty acid repression mutant protein) [Alkalihalobacillus xiaoxiensis]|uniref:Oxidoreductase (Fatty acid repression mutant protein) n=1 Tax=Shouchella xiaoxiensis TaxID=766895 RepID=A0ABS2ST78_9BACI|nr:putative oxidoreductase (fatty acid repression mutant protein) [Shouchella xiaoxiensis]